MGMAVSQPIKDRVRKFKEEYDRLKLGKESLLAIIDEAEIAESVYNSNAIENSTLTLKETEKILLEMEVSRNVSLREVFEAKNLARVVEYIRAKSQESEISKEMILLLHQMLIGNINDEISGRFRKSGEYVRVGAHIAPAPENIEKNISDLLVKYTSDQESYFLEKITFFHLEFEFIHPFNDGNGRIGRAVTNYQLQRLGFPSIIIRDKEKQKYYAALKEYEESRKVKMMERIFALALMEALHKRLAYLAGANIVDLSDYIKKQGLASSAVLNSARRQTIPAFREKGVWKIGEKYYLSS